MRIRERAETGSTENGEKEAYTGIRFSSPPAFSRERANERKIEGLLVYSTHVDMCL